jgi:integrase
MRPQVVQHWYKPGYNGHMESQHEVLRIYRRHTSKCVHGHSEPIFENEKKQQDCSCNLCVAGYLRNELDGDRKQRRIRHFSLETTDWKEARQKRDQYLTWGQLKPPASGIDSLKGDRVTVEDAVKFFFQSNSTKGGNTLVKYQLLLNRRLVPWCKSQGIRLLRRFDEPVTCRAFFNSWAKRRNVDNHAVLETDQKLATNTVRAALERYRAFLTFCVENEWLKTNHAKKIKTATHDVVQKIAWTKSEYERIVRHFEEWKDEYGRVGSPGAIRQSVFFLTLRYTGQRISDVGMLGPDNLVQDRGNWFISLRQIKTGASIRVPVPVHLVEKLQALPIRAELDLPYRLKTNNRTIQYGSSFWFWTGESDPYNHARVWSDHICSVLADCEKTTGKFHCHSTAHTARHFFAISNLNAGVPIERVAKWLGHSTSEITSRHYSGANSDWHQDSHAAYMKALDQIEGTKPKGKVVRMRAKVR